jgi:apolipoprotein N-acyltransferase
MFIYSLNYEHLLLCVFLNFLFSFLFPPPPFWVPGVLGLVAPAGLAKQAAQGPGQMNI